MQYRNESYLELIRQKSEHLYVELLASPEKAMTYLSASSRVERQAAILVCGRHWKIRDKFPEYCRTIASSDPDDTVRICAIDVLAELNESTCDREMSRFFADLLKANAHSSRLQLAAYYGLRQIHLEPTANARRLFKLLSGIKLSGATISEEALRNILVRSDLSLPPDIEGLLRIDWLFVDKVASLI